MADQLITPQVNPEIQRMVDALTPEYLRKNTNVVDPNAQPGKIPAVEPMNFAPFLTADLVGNAAGLGAKGAATLASKLSPHAAALALLPQKINASAGIKRFNIINELGKHLGETTIMERSPKDLWVEWIGRGAHKEEGHPNSLGLTELRSLLPEVKKLYPEAERIGGYRSTGARGKIETPMPRGWGVAGDTPVQDAWAAAPSGKETWMKLR